MTHDAEASNPGSGASPAPAARADFRERTVRGVLWSAGAQIARQSVALLTVVILSRILDKRDFGLVQIVVNITGYGLVLADSGMSGAIVQRRDLRPSHMATAFWTNLMLGFALTAGLYLGAPLLAQFFGQPSLVELCQFMSPMLLLSGATALPRALLTRALDFRAIAVIDTTAILIAGSVSIVMAWAGFGPWAIATQYLVAALVTWIMSWVISERPSGRPDRASMRELSGFSLNLFGNESLAYVTRNIDNTLIAWRWGPNALAPYGLAYQIMMLPLTNISRVVTRALFPSFSEIQDDPARIKRVFLQMTSVIAWLAFPALLGLAAVARPFTLAIFGERWAAMIPILRLLCVAGAIQTVIHPIGSALMARGRADLLFRVGLVLKASVVIAIIIGLKWGPIGVAAAVLVVTVLNAIPNVAMLRRVIGLDQREYLAAIGSTFAASGVMAVAIFGLDRWLPATWPGFSSANLSGFVRLGVLVNTGVALFIGLTLALRLNAWLELRRLIRERGRKGS